MVILRGCRLQEQLEGLMVIYADCWPLGYKLVVQHLVVMLLVCSSTVSATDFR